MIKAVLFDLDGTLLNRDESVRGFIENQYVRLHQYLGHIPKDRYINRFIELDQRGYVWKDKVYQQLVEEFRITEIEWGYLLEDYISEFKHHCLAFPHLRQMLDELRSMPIRLGIVTNGRGRFQMDNIVALNMEGYFDAILISDWEGIKKPDPRIFRRAIERLDVIADECAFVGDHPENDVKAAQAIGLTGIWKKDDQQDDAEADYIVKDLNELPRLIRSINNHVIDCGKS
ncbi:HAD family hydrolase [Bacillus sp. 1P06AnD]|uniref:HAD family hydrolase n=1 Tax=Bacillus sp. 1P06AnD TaxID=3132208 RepID=UPI00399FA216